MEQEIRIGFEAIKEMTVGEVLELEKSQGGKNNGRIKKNVQ